MSKGLKGLLRISFPIRPTEGESLELEHQRSIESKVILFSNALLTKAERAYCEFD